MVSKMGKKKKNNRGSNEDCVRSIRTDREITAVQDAILHAPNSMLASGVEAAHVMGEQANQDFPCYNKIISTSVEDREEGCLDIAQLAQSGASSLRALLNHERIFPELLEILLSGDRKLREGESICGAPGDWVNVPVRTAAANAIKNILLAVGDGTLERSIPHNSDIHDVTLLSSDDLIDKFITPELCSGVAKLLSTTKAQMLSDEALMTMSCTGVPLTNSQKKLVLSGDPLTTAQQLSNQPLQEDEINNDNATAENDIFETMRDSLFRCLDEVIQLIGVLSDSHHAAAEFFSWGHMYGQKEDRDGSSPVVASILIDCLGIGMDQDFYNTLCFYRNKNETTGFFGEFDMNTTSNRYKLASSAAECLHLLSSDNSHFSTFITRAEGGISSQQSELLNSLVSDIRAMASPTASSPQNALNPALLLISLHLGAVLLNASPTPESALKLLPLVSLALETLPMAEWKRLIPLLTEGGCEVITEDSRRIAVKETLDRFRCLQVAFDILSEIIRLICESHDDSMEDEVAFAQNPHSSLLLSAGILPSVLAVLQSILSTSDIVVVKALREVTDNTEVTSVQSAFMAVEVGVLSVVSSLMYLLPMSALGSGDVIWRTCVAAVEIRHLSLVETKGQEGTTHPAESQMILQIESLVEMCWSTLRKDNTFTVLPAEIDIFTRISWEGYVSCSTVVFVVSVVGCIGQRSNTTTELNHSCGRFCVAIVGRAVDAVEQIKSKFVSGEVVGVLDAVEMGAEAANVLIDLYSNEEYDRECYVPLGIQGKLSQLVPILEKVIKVHFGKRKSSHKKEHLMEILDNLKGFLDYKAKNVKF